jgi:hypothetical protein
MNCHFCNDETVITSATGLCAVCNYPACARPSGRSDNKFHGDTCRHARCNAFICEYDTHDHTSAVVGHTPLPYSFPAMSLAIGLDALSAAESSFGHWSDSPLEPDSNMAMSRYLSFSHPEWRATAISLAPSAVMSFIKKYNGERLSVKEMKPEYFDPQRVAYLTLKAGESVSVAWSVLDRPEREGFEQELPSDVVRRIEEFSTSDSKEGASLQGMINALNALSPRLEAFVAESMNQQNFWQRRNILDFEIQEEIGFTPSRGLRSMEGKLALTERAAMLKA